MRRPRLALALAALAVVVLGAGVGVGFALQRRAEHRLAAGVPVSARVLDVAPVGFADFGGPEITVQYDVRGVTYRAALMSMWGRDFDTGGSGIIDVYVDPADPRRVAARPGFLSEDRYARLPAAAVAAGLGLLVVCAHGRWGRRPVDRSGRRLLDRSG